MDITSVTRRYYDTLENNSGGATFDFAIYNILQKSNSYMHHNYVCAGPIQCIIWFLNFDS